MTLTDLSFQLYFYRSRTVQAAIFTGRRYASAAYAVFMCPYVRQSVCLSVTNRCCIETTGRIELILAWRLLFAIPTMCYKENWVSPEIRVLPSGILSQSCPKLRTWKISPRQVDRVVNKTRRRRRRQRSSLSTTPTRQSTSRGCLLQVDQPSRTPFLRYGVQLVSTVDNILTDNASRGPSAVAELLVASVIDAR